MRVRDIMSRPVVSVRADTPVREATAALADGGFAALPVLDDAERVIGVFGQADALRRGVQVPGRAVAEVMTTPVEVVGPADDTATAADRMLRHHLRSLPVVEEGVLVGIVSRQDLLRVLVRDDDVVAGRVRALLDDYAGSTRRWSITVAEGVVRVRGSFADEAERRVITALVRTLDGVLAVEAAGGERTDLAWRD
ncbi:CBS domain-containing protein [Actinokineospora guangxiensis]|uniref:CBS domain-containing protein n=1 Tax=Actinokineospora guangxiensis TaxID=1490288 RepID=A0ABW0EMH0_9PSEU